MLVGSELEDRGRRGRFRARQKLVERLRVRVEARASRRTERRERRDQRPRSERREVDGSEKRVVPEVDACASRRPVPAVAGVARPRRVPAGAPPASAPGGAARPRRGPADRPRAAAAAPGLVRATTREGRRDAAETRRSRGRPRRVAARPRAPRGSPARGPGFARGPSSRSSGRRPSRSRPEPRTCERATRLSAVRAPFVLIFAASDGWWCPLEVRCKNHGPTSKDLRSARSYGSLAANNS